MKSFDAGGKNVVLVNFQRCGWHFALSSVLVTTRYLFCLGGCAVELLLPCDEGQYLSSYFMFHGFLVCNNSFDGC